MKGVPISTDGDSIHGSVYISWTLSSVVMLGNPQVGGVISWMGTVIQGNTPRAACNIYARKSHNAPPYFSSDSNWRCATSLPFMSCLFDALWGPDKNHSILKE